MLLRNYFYFSNLLLSGYLMKLVLSLLLFFSIAVHSQQRLFENQIIENAVPKENKLSDDLRSTFISTKYYSQQGFDLKQDLLVKLPDNSILEALYQYTISHTVGTFSAVYKIKNEASGELIFSQADNVITGMYISENVKKVVFQQSGIHTFAVSEVNESVFSSRESRLDGIADDSAPNRNSLANSDVCLATTPICPGATVIDIMVVYTDAARISWGSSAVANSTITSAVSNMTVALVNSGVTGISFNLVYVGQISYVESGSFQTDLSRLRATADGYMDEVHALRTTYGADLVGLSIASPNSLCGLGYLNNSATNYSNSLAFTVTLYSCLLSNITLAHEAGHNMGFNHDWYVSTGTLPCSHHHGYINRLAISNGPTGPTNQKWRTIMAYSDECADNGFNCPKINRWANPSVNYNGQPTGIPIGEIDPSDEAFGLRRAACVVAGFMPTTLHTNQYAATSFSVFPNPTKENFTIVCDMEIGDVKIYNHLGQFVLGSKEKTVTTDMLATGVYYVKIYDTDGKSLGVRKIIKE